MILTAGGLDQAPADAEWWQVAIERFGLPIAILVILVVTGMRQGWVFGWQYKQVQKALEDEHAEATRLREVIEGMHKEGLQREQQLVAGLAPRVYDAALLYREREAVAPRPHDLDDLAERLNHLTDLMERGTGPRGAEPGARGVGPGDRSGT